MTAHFVDISTTMFAVGRGLGKELNPLLAPHIENAAAVGAFKGAVAVGANYPLLVLHESSPKLTLALGIGQCVGFSLIGAHNARVIRDAR